MERVIDAVDVQASLTGKFSSSEIFGAADGDVAPLPMPAPALAGPRRTLRRGPASYGKMGCELSKPKTAAEAVRAST